MNLNLKEYLHKIKDWANVINIDEYRSIETYWIASSVNVDNVPYFERFVVEYLLKEILKIYSQQRCSNKY